MSRFPEVLAVAALAVLLSTQSLAAEDFGIGRPATPQEIAEWDIDVRPDGRGLPAGQGSASGGEAIYAERCAQCHGDFGEGLGRYPALIGGGNSLATENPVRTVGSYWPYATTLWDYIYRAMPFGAAQSLTHDEAYAITAYLLYLNDIVDEDFMVDRNNLASIEMPNRHGFVSPNPQPDTPSGRPCMTDCKGPVEIVSEAGTLDVTPAE